jgi:hypothetical protein
MRARGAAARPSPPAAGGGERRRRRRAMVDPGAPARPNYNVGQKCMRGQLCDLLKNPSKPPTRDRGFFLSGVVNTVVAAHDIRQKYL